MIELAAALIVLYIGAQIAWFLLCFIWAVIDSL